MTTAKHRAMDAATYHADRSAISSGMIEDFLQSRRLFEGRYITDTVPKKEPTDAMRLGTLIHMRLLEPEKYRELVVVTPEDAPDRRSRNWWSAFEAEHEGKEIVTNEGASRIESIARSVLSKRWARSLLNGAGQPEFDVFWTDAETGLPCKILVDWFRPICCFDLKTTADASPAAFSRSAANLGYFRKKHHYLAGIQAFTDQETPLLHVAVCTAPPYAAGAYNLVDNSWDGTSNGHAQWRRALEQIAECYATGDWSDPWEREVIDLAAPAFAYSENAYLM